MPYCFVVGSFGHKEIVSVLSADEFTWRLIDEDLRVKQIRSKENAQGMYLYKMHPVNLLNLLELTGWAVVSMAKCDDVNHMAKIHPEIAGAVSWTLRKIVYGEEHIRYQEAYAPSLSDEFHYKKRLADAPNMHSYGQN